MYFPFKKLNKKILFLGSLFTALFSLPMLVLAIDIPPAPEIGTLDLQTIIDNIFNLIWPIFAGFAVIMLIWAGILFLVARGDMTKLTQARGALIWGVVGVAVALLSFSIPLIIKNTFGV
jgi:hypothetical protein